MTTPLSTTVFPLHPDLRRPRGRRPRVRVGLDLDGVLADTLSAYAAIAERDYDLSDSATHPRDYAMVADGWFADHAQMRRATATMHDDYLDDLPVLESGLPDQIVRLREALGDVDVIVVTSRTPHAGHSGEHLRRRTRTWLASRGLEVDRVIFSGAKQATGVHYLLEDNPAELTPTATLSPAERPIVVARDWTYNNPATAHGDLPRSTLTPHRVGSVAAFVDALADIYALEVSA